MSKIPNPLFKSFRHLGRYWWKRSRPVHIEKRKEKNFEFTIASYNVLADQLLHEHPHLYYENDNEPWVYDWNYRRSNLIEEIKCSDADILCLQEVQEEHYYNWFHPRLREQGYTGLYKKRSGDKKDGCATFFKHDRFSMESYKFVDFHRHGCSFMDRNNVALLLFLQPLSGTKAKKHQQICIGNTHLLFNQKRGDIKLAQLAYLFAEVNRLAKSYLKTSKYLPILLCGDFNSVPFSPLYNLVTKGELRYEGLSKHSISGQREDLHQSSSKFTNSIFPKRLGLSSNCKWITTDANDIENDSKACSNPFYDGNDDKDVQILNVSTGNFETVKPSTTVSCRKPSSTSSSCERFNETPGYLHHDFQLKSSYLHYLVDGTREVTTCHDRASVTVDYIFHSNSINRKAEHEQLWLSGVLTLLTEHDLKSMGNLPNRYISSDHLMLMASFVLL